MFRVRYIYEGRPCYSGTRSYESAKAIVHAGEAEAVVLDETGFPQVYPETQGDSHALRIES